MLTSTKLGKALGLTKATICTLARQGRIPYIQLPSGHRRFDLEAVTSALSMDSLASAFLYPTDDCAQLHERLRILDDMWAEEARKINFFYVGDDFECEREEALRKLSVKYEEAYARAHEAFRGSSEKGAK
jgi:hypothetical protein